MSKTRSTQSVGKYFDRPVDGAVTFSRDGHEYRADCMVHLASGLHLQAQGRSTDIYASFDAAIERMDKRLRRYKSRIRDHHNGARGSIRRRAPRASTSSRRRARRAPRSSPRR